MNFIELFELCKILDLNQMYKKKIINFAILCKVICGQKSESIYIPIHYRYIVDTYVVQICS